MQTVILAGGQSSRFWPLNEQHKSLFKIMGRPLIWYTIESLKESGKVDDIIIVQDDQRSIEKELENYGLKIKIQYVTQPEPKGMGDAILATKGLIKGHFLVLDPYHFEIEEILGVLQKTGIEKELESESESLDMVLFGQKTDRPQDYGIFKFEDSSDKRVIGIVEKPEKGKEPSDKRVVGIYILPSYFFDYLQKTGGQYSFEDAIDLYIKEKGNLATIVDIPPNIILPSLKYPWHLFEVSRLLMAKYLPKPEREDSAEISEEATVKGDVYIGKNAKIFEGAVIKGPCYIGDNCIVGNNSLVREYSSLENGAIVGAFAEVARSILQENCHVHSGYFGDSILGKDCRIGAGTVTANVRLDKGEIRTIVKKEKISTGLKSFGIIMGENTHTGIHCSFMPGVLIGSNCIIAPASLVSKNIENNSRFLNK